MIVFLGSNPSHAANSSAAFCASTKSGQTIRSWIAKLGLIATRTSFYNVANRRTPKNRPLNKKEIKVAAPGIKTHIEYLEMLYKEKIHVVAVGKTAVEAMKLLDMPFYEWPHPSGLNRQLNEPGFIEEKIKGLQEYLKTF